MKCADTVGSGSSGYDAGKKIKGRKRHILTDTQGHLLGVTVTPASVQDRDGAKVVCCVFCHQWQRLEVIFADGGYAGKLENFVQAAGTKFGHQRGLRLEIIGGAGAGVRGNSLEMLAWLLGRADGAGLEPVGIESLPAAPPWR